MQPYLPDPRACIVNACGSELSPSPRCCCLPAARVSNIKLLPLHLGEQQQMQHEHQQLLPHRLSVYVLVSLWLLSSGFSGA